MLCWRGRPVGAYHLVPLGSLPAVDGKTVCITCHDIHATDGVSACCAASLERTARY
jgi:hypothetical protein